METWLQVVGYEGSYEVSDLGRVRNSHGKVLVHRVGKDDPRRTVSLWKKNKGRSRRVHILVLEAFKGLRPPGMVGCHNDGNIQNNVLPNLRWDTQAGNMADTLSHGTATIGEKSATAKLTEEDVKKIRMDLRSQQKIANDFGVCQTQISRIKRRVRWAHSS